MYILERKKNLFGNRNLILESICGREDDKSHKTPTYGTRGD